MPTIHSVILSEEWDEVRQKLKSREKDDLFSSTNIKRRRGMNPFHIACAIKGVPQDIIRAMLVIDEANLIASTQHAIANVKPLHIACELGSAATVRTLLMVASDNDDDDFKECALGKDSKGVGALVCTWMKPFNYNDETNTPSEFLYELERINSPVDLEGRVKDAWNKTVLLLEACTTGPVKGCFSNGGQWNMVHSIAHAAASKIGVPTVALWLALKLFPEQARFRDGDGNLPLHVVSAGTFVHILLTDEAQAEMDDEAKMIYEQIHDLPLQMLLNLYPDAPYIPNKLGRLPLHIALHHGSSGETVAMFLKAAPESVNKRDPLTMLFPFMLAACDAKDKDRDNAVLDATYVLLRENPANVQGGIRLTEYERYLSRRLAEEKAKATKCLAQNSELKHQREKDLAKISKLESRLRKRKHGDE